MPLINNIKTIRNLKGISPKEMASQLSISVSSYNKIERREIELTINRALKIASILDVRIQDLFNFDSTKILFQEQGQTEIVKQSHDLKIKHESLYITFLENEIIDMKKKLQE